MTQETVRVDWPVGPEYAKWVSADTGTAKAWSNYKLRSADWYIDLLDRLCRRHGFSRLVGIEMALDGALSALSSAFDAAVAGVIVAAEERRQVSASVAGHKTPKRCPPHKYNWAAAESLLKRADVLGDEPTTRELATKVVDVVTEALQPPPTGWLETLRRLRNQATHQDTVARFIDARIGGPNGDGTEWLLTVNGEGVDPVQYLQEAREQVNVLINGHLLLCADRLAPGGMATTPGNTRQSVTVHAPPAVLGPLSTPAGHADTR